MFALPDSWVWDFWTADDGERYHLFFLFASKALKDPERRHYRAGIGHAVSTDLAHWTRVEDVLVHAASPAFDDLATWTGSVVRHPDGTWLLFYTGATLAASGSNEQRVGLATSPDLYSWTRHPGPVAEADDRWYEPLDGGWHDWAFRDPWVFADPDGNGWHMLVTARGNTGPVDDRGVVGHCWSPDLRTWEVREPLSRVGQGFGHLEVLHTVEVDGHHFLLFSCPGRDLSAARRKAAGAEGGTWAATAGSALGPYDLAGASVISPPGLYVGRLVPLRDTGEWRFLAFVHQTPDGGFGGTIIDPLPVSVVDGRLVVG